MSRFFEWNESKFSVHVPQMDAEHRAIIACMNRLHDLHEAKVTGQKLVNTVIELGNITVKHFADEETYMRKIGFPDLANHALIHKRLLENFSRHKEQAVANGTVSDEFFTFLKTWLKIHICGIDMKYSEHRQAA